MDGTGGKCLKENENQTLQWRDSPGGPVVKILPCNTGYLGLIPGQGTKIPHASEQLTLHAISIEPTTREPVHDNERS